MKWFRFWFYATVPYVWIILAMTLINRSMMALSYLIGFWMLYIAIVTMMIMMINAIISEDPFTFPWEER